MSKPRLGIAMNFGRFFANAERARCNLLAAGVAVNAAGIVRLTPAAQQAYSNTQMPLDVPPLGVANKWAKPGYAPDEWAPPPSVADEDDPTCIPESRQGVASGTMRSLDHIEAARIWTEASAADRVDFFSAGGAHQGRLWAWPTQRLDNDMFRIAVLRRAAALDFDGHMQCQMQFAEDGSRSGERCLQPMAHRHDVRCHAGPPRRGPISWSA